MGDGQVLAEYIYLSTSGGWTCAAEAGACWFVGWAYGSYQAIYVQTMSVGPDPAYVGSKRSGWIRAGGDRLITSEPKCVSKVSADMGAGG